MAMESKGTALVVAAAVQRHRASRSHATLADYWALTKPEVNFLILTTTGTAFYLGYPTQGHQFPFTLLIHTLLGTLLVASGTGTLNQFVEWRFDAQMRRTAWRPIPAGRLAPSAALRFGILLSLAGSIYLAAAVNALASLLAVLTSISYLFLYTPLKRRTPLCTLVGALPGAMPPLIGWAAASGNLSSEAWILYALLFLWQLPHFMAIAWMYREDYARAGYLVLPRGEGRGRLLAWQSILPTVVLVPTSVIPMLRSHTSLIAPVGVLALSCIFFCFGTDLAIRRSNLAARRLLLASIIYLPFVFVLIVLDKLLFSTRY
jgi:protoheme IX farnesyltransferase